MTLEMEVWRIRAEADIRHKIALAEADADPRDMATQYRLMALARWLECITADVPPVPDAERSVGVQISRRLAVASLAMGGVYQA